MYILGLATMGDAAAALIKDGELIAAAEEERFSRVKHHVGFPHRAVDYVLSEAGIGLGDVGHVGLYWKPWVLSRRVLATAGSLMNSGVGFRARVRRGSHQVGTHYRQMLTLPRRLREQHGPSDFRFHYLDHHVCHAASCFHVSPHGRAAIFTVDGTGEATTTMFARGDGNRIEVLKRIKLPHSLGQFYSAVTNFLGFDMTQGDEWKVMGLAGWGDPVYYDYFIRHVLLPVGRSGFRVNHRLLDHHLAKHYVFSPELMKVVGPSRAPGGELTEAHRNVAASAQKALEEVVLRMLGWLHEVTGEKTLCMAGGVALNSLMNGRIMRETPFEEFYFQPAAGDSGCALGACYQIWNGLLHRPRGFVMTHGYWGPEFSEERCRAALEARGLPYERLDEDGLVGRVAERLAAGHMVAWFHGRMEWGPRGLGHRSFLADPRDPNTLDKLNTQVKLREWFRPLAPSMLAEEAHRVFGKPWFDPFMITVFPVDEAMKPAIPAVVHVNGTARPQTVTREANPRYWKLLKEFDRLTGVPCLLNTSFNIQEPIVCTPEEAVNTYLNSRVGNLVLENFLVTREEHAERGAGLPAGPNGRCHGTGSGAEAGATG